MRLPPDAELVARLKAGDEQLFEDVVGQYRRSLEKLALTWVRTRASAEEVVQDTWLAVVRGLAAFEGRASFKTWLFTILANRARTRAVRDSRLVPFPAAAGDDGEDSDRFGDRWAAGGRWALPPPDWRHGSAEQQAVTHELAGLVMATLDALPAAQRAVLVLRDVEGIDAAEACAILGITPGHQRVLLHRGRTRVRAALERRLGLVEGGIRTASA